MKKIILRIVTVFGCVSCYAAGTNEIGGMVEVTLSFDNRIGIVGKEIYGGFVEHLGRNVYGGVYDPSDKTADEDGFRRDVIAEMKALRTSVFRYPGGCFTDLWRWEDGIGPRDRRPVRIDPFWKQLEDNSFGLDEFMKWVAKVGAEPMITINLSTRGLPEAAQMWEYLRFPKGTTLSDQRRKNGREQPYPIRYWCLGNELHGHWEYGHREPERYGSDAREVAKFLKQVDPDAVTILSGSECNQKWNETVLDLAWKWTDYLSMHMGTYSPGKDFSRIADVFAENLERTFETIKRVNSRKPEKERKEMRISVDEYYIWDGVNGDDETEFTKGRHLLENDYTALDAVVLGDLHIALHNHADIVKFANIAQSVNAIAPIRTEKDGKLWHQSIYDPLRLASIYGCGQALGLKWSGNGAGDLRASAVWNEAQGELAVFVVDRDAVKAHDFRLSVPGDWQVALSVEISGGRAEKNGPGMERVRAKSVTDATFAGGALSMVLKPFSWRLVVLRKGAASRP